MKYSVVSGSVHFGERHVIKTFSRRDAAEQYLLQIIKDAKANGGTGLVSLRVEEIG